MKYLRTYPLGMQLLLFLLMAFTLLSAAIAVTSLAPKLADIPAVSLQDINEKSSQAVVRVALLMQAIGSLMIFSLSSFLFAYLTHPSPKKYLGMQAPKKPIHLLLAVLVMLGAMPAFMALQSLMGLIDFGPEIKKQQAAAEAVFAAYLAMPTFADFIRTFIVVAMVPALGEELFFRGVIMRFTHKSSRKMPIAIVFSAVMFAFVHASYTGLPSIFLAGVLLAVIYYLTGSLWCGIMAHMFFNGSQIILSYIGHSNPAVASVVNDTHIQWGLVAGGTALFAVSFYLLWKTKTPLPDNWSDDFDTPQNIQPDEDSTIFN